MKDGEHDLLGSLEQDAEAAGEPLDDRRARFRRTRDYLARARGVSPAEVFLERTPLVLPGRVVVELADDEQRQVPPAQSELGRLASARELRQRDDDRRIAVQRAARAVLALGVTGEEKPIH